MAGCSCGQGHRNPGGDAWSYLCRAPVAEATDVLGIATGDGIVLGIFYNYSKMIIQVVVSKRDWGI